MEHKILKTEGGSQELEIIIEDAEYESYYTKAYNNLKKHVSIPGFRKGKVPFAMVKKHYGGMLEQEAIQEAAQASFQTVVEENDIKVISQPELLNADRNNGVMKFNFRYDVYPDVTLADYKGINIQEPVHEVTGEEVDEEIQKLLNQHGDFEEAEEIDDNNYVVGITFQRVDEESREPMEGFEPVEQNVYLNDEKADPELINTLISHKVGEKVDYVIPHNHDHDHDHDDHDHDHDHSDMHYEIQIRDVQKLLPKELNDEFVKEITKEKFTNVEDFKEDMEMQLQKNWDNESRNALEDQIVTKIVNDNPDIAVPETFIENAQKQLVNNFKQQFGAQMPDTSEEQDKALYEEVRPMAERTVRWELIRNKIVDEEGIKVEDFDIEQLANQQAPLYNMDPEQLKKMFEANENIQAQILTKKVIDHVLDFAITEEVEFDDLNND